MSDNPNYSPAAVQRAIMSSRRHGRPIGRREAEMIHRLLSGRAPRSEISRQAPGKLQETNKKDSK